MKMHTTQTLLDSIKAKKGIPSDYALASFLGVSKQKISQYRRGDYCLGDDRARFLADELGLDRGEVLLSIHAERAKKQHDEQTYLDISNVLKRLGGIAASFILFSIFSPVNDAHALMRPSFDDNTHYPTWIGRQASRLRRMLKGMRTKLAIIKSHNCSAAFTA